MALSGTLNLPLLRSLLLPEGKSLPPITPAYQSGQLHTIVETGIGLSWQKVRFFLKCWSGNGAILESWLRTINQFLS